MPKRKQPIAGRKLLQLCEQIKESLAWSLTSSLNDDRFAMAYVLSVTPLPGNNRLLVQVAIPRDVPLEHAVLQLQQASPTLRMEVAQAITRRKAPELVFLPIPDPTG